MSRFIAEQRWPMKNPPESPIGWMVLLGLRVLLLVLSIAVLVLVLDWILLHTIGQHAPPCSMVESITSVIRVGVRVPRC